MNLKSISEYKISLLFLLLTILVYLIFVHTIPGQIIDEILLHTDNKLNKSLQESINKFLLLLPVISIIFITFLSLIVGFFKNNWVRILIIFSMILMNNLTIQIFKYYVCKRSNFGISEIQINSLPSGHTTLIASISSSTALLFNNIKLKNIFIYLSFGYSSMIGLFTIINRWHRFSDIIASLLLTASWTLLMVKFLPISYNKHRKQNIKNTILVKLSNILYFSLGIIFAFISGFYSFYMNKKNIYNNINIDNIKCLDTVSYFFNFFYYMNMLFFISSIIIFFIGYLLAEIISSFLYSKLK